MSIPQNVIELRGAGKDFGLSGRRGEARTRALEDVSLAIPQGQFVCLLGPSGCGKSTILNLV
ncbi:ATP-binding cassette domain-containing protein, partial [Achromobacter xylosoxidans]